MNKSISFTSHTMFTNFTPALILHSPSGSEFSAGRLCSLGIFPWFSLFFQDFPQVHQVDTCQGSTGWNPSQSTQSANCWQSTEASRCPMDIIPMDNIHLTPNPEYALESITPINVFFLYISASCVFFTLHYNIRK